MDRFLRLKHIAEILGYSYRTIVTYRYQGKLADLPFEQLASGALGIWESKFNQWKEQGGRIA